MVSGIDSCSSKFSCLRCKCPSEEERYNTALTWSTVEEIYGARTNQEIASMIAIKSQSNKFNCSNPPIHKRALAEATHDIFPSWGHLREKQRDITPIVIVAFWITYDYN